MVVFGLGWIFCEGFCGFLGVFFKGKGFLLKILLKNNSNAAELNSPAATAAFCIFITVTTVTPNEV